MNGRRIRGKTQSQITKLNQQIQLINESIANSMRILEDVEHTLKPNDYLGMRIEDNYQYQTWRTVGVLNLTDHFIVRYMQRIHNVSIKESSLQYEYDNYSHKEKDMYTVWFMVKYGIIDDDMKREIRDFVKNPPDDIRVVRCNDRVITILTNEGEYL